MKQLLRAAAALILAVLVAPLFLREVPPARAQNLPFPIPAGIPGPVVTGSVIAFAGATPPQGYLLCDGSAVSRTTYPGLFAVIATMYGKGDGATTFNLPDLRTRAVFGARVPTPSATDLFWLSTAFGSALTSLQPRHLPRHTHPVIDPGHAHATAGTIWTVIGGFQTGFIGLTGLGGDGFPGQVERATTGIAVGGKRQRLRFPGWRAVLGLESRHGAQLSHQELTR